MDLRPHEGFSVKISLRITAPLHLLNASINDTVSFKHQNKSAIEMLLRSEVHWYQGSYIKLSGGCHLKVSGGRHLKVSGGRHLKNHTLKLKKYLADAT